MFRSYTLQPATAHDAPLVFEWNPETGELRGPGADLVADLCRRAVQDGYVQGYPYPTSFDVANPLRNAAEMAVVLGQYWRLDGELLAAYPATQESSGLVEIAADRPPAAIFAEF